MKATTRFTAAVANLMRSEGLSFDLAWGEARRRHPGLYLAMDMAGSGADAVNELPPGANLSADGQRLTGEWPVPPAVLGALGLPLSASREQYEIFRTAEKVKELDPTTAAKLFVLLIRHSQLSHGTGFDDVAESVRRHFPDLLVALRKLDHVTLAAKESAPPAAAVNEVRDRPDRGVFYALGPGCSFPSSWVHSAPEVTEARSRPISAAGHLALRR